MPIVPERLNAFSRVVCASTLVLAGTAYLLTLAPSVVQIDSGELAAVQSTLGIAHPTGYPLFTLLGHIVSRIPLDIPTILQMNLLATLWCVTAVWFFFLAAKRWLLLLRGRPETASSILLAAASALFLASSTTFWTQATSVEVYSLHMLLMSAAMYFSMRILGKADAFRSWLILAAILGLSFGNHMTALLLLPATAYLFLATAGKGRYARRVLLSACGIFLFVWIGLLLYLPIRAHQNPALNWGAPRTLGALFRHITGRQYSTWLFSSPGAAVKNLRRFASGLPGEFSWPALALGGIGLWQTIRRHRRLAAFSAIAFVTTVLYAVNYDIHDLDAYFLLAYLVLALWIGSGAGWLYAKLRRVRLTPVCAGILLLCLGHQTCSRFPGADRSDVYVFEDYTKQALESLPGGALLLSYQWDVLISPAYYFQFVENHRRDIAIVDKELLRRSWYYHQLQTNYPDILEGVRALQQAFLEALRPFERGGDYDAGRLESLFRRLILRIVETNLDERPVFIAPELVTGELRRGEIRLPPGVDLVPDLFFFRAVRSEHYVPLGTTDMLIRFPESDDEYSRSIRSFLSRMLTWRAMYEARHDKEEAVERLKRSFILHFPQSPLPPVFRDG